jgi:hypothetical protein
MPVHDRKSEATRSRRDDSPVNLLSDLLICA